MQRGIELAEALTDSGGLEQRDLLYLVAVSGGCDFVYVRCIVCCMHGSGLEQRDLLYLVAVSGRCCGFLA